MTQVLAWHRGAGLIPVFDLPFGSDLRVLGRQLLLMVSFRLVKVFSIKLQLLDCMQEHDGRRRGSQAVKTRRLRSTSLRRRQRANSQSQRARYELSLALELCCRASWKCTSSLTSIIFAPLPWCCGAGDIGMTFVL